MEVNTLTVIVSIISAIIVGGITLFGYGFKFGKDIQKLTENIDALTEDIAKLTEDIANTKNEIKEDIVNTKNEIEKNIANTKDKIEEEVANTKSKLEEDVANTKNKVNILIELQSKFMNMNEENFKGLFTILAKSNLLNSNDMPNLWESFVTPYKETMSFAVTSLKSTNPLTQQEIENIKNYTNKAINGERFTVEEATDFYSLAKRVSEEKGNDEAWTVIWVVSGFILGLTLGSKSDGKK